MEPTFRASMNWLHTWAGVVLEDTRTVGWSSLLTCRVEEVAIGDDDRPLVHHRGRYVRPTT